MCIMLNKRKLMMKKINRTSLENKLNKWKKILKLDAWNITINWVKPKTINNDLAEIEICSYPEKVATIAVSTHYDQHAHHGKVFNLDSIILHELIHIVFWEHVQNLPSNFTENKKFEEFEEYMCDYFSRVLIEMKSKSKKTLGS